jgi:proline iminopeptidase
MITRAILVAAMAAAAPGLARAAPASKPALENGEFTVRLNGLRLWYRVSGQGPVCLMPSPGWGPSADLYFRTLKPLERRFTIVYFDPRGTGRSERPKAATEYTWDHLVADLDALRAHLKQDKVWMMGHSEGGMQIMHYASRYPDRVQGLILLATMAVMRPADPSVIARALRRKDEPWFPEVMKAYQAGFPKTDEEMAAQQRKLLPMLWADPARIEKHQEHFAATSMSVDAWRGMQASRNQGFDLTGELRRVTAPALIVAGDKDILCPPAAAR